MFVSSIVRYGGGERWMCDAAAGLGARGYRVLLVARPDSVLAERAGERGVDCEHVEMRADLDPLAVWGIARCMRRFRPDVVCMNLDREIRLSAVARTLARRVLLAPLASTRLIPRRGSEFPLKDKFHYRFVYTRLVDCVITNSRATRDTMLAPVPWFARDRAVIIYNGIDVDAYDRLERDRCRARLRRELGLRVDAPVIVLVGELNERKGHRFIVQAAPGVLSRVPDAHFVFAGDGDARVDIEQMIANSGLRDHFSLTGFRTDVPEILVGSDVLVLPSRIEGFGYVLAEAMAARLPVVATAASSIPEIVDDGYTGYLHAFGDSRAIAAHLTTLLTDPARRAEMAKAGYETVRERFHVNRMVDDLETLFFGAASTRS